MHSETPVSNDRDDSGLSSNAQHFAFLLASLLKDRPTHFGAAWNTDWYLSMCCVVRVSEPFRAIVTMSLILLMDIQDDDFMLDMDSDDASAHEPINTWQELHAFSRASSIVEVINLLERLAISELEFGIALPLECSVNEAEPGTASPVRLAAQGKRPKGGLLELGDGVWLVSVDGNELFLSGITELTDDNLYVITLKHGVSAIELVLCPRMKLRHSQPIEILGAERASGLAATRVSQAIHHTKASNIDYTDFSVLDFLDKWG